MFALGVACPWQVCGEREPTRRCEQFPAAAWPETMWVVSRAAIELSYRICGGSWWQWVCVLRWELVARSMCVAVGAGGNGHVCWSGSWGQGACVLWKITPPLGNPHLAPIVLSVVLTKQNRNIPTIDLLHQLLLCTSDKCFPMTTVPHVFSVSDFMFFVFLHMRAVFHVSPSLCFSLCMWRSGIDFSPLIMWVLRIQLRSLGLVASAFLHWAVSMVQAAADF